MLITASDSSLLPIWLLKLKPQSTLHFVSDRRQCRTVIVQELIKENDIASDRVHCYESIKDVVKYLLLTVIEVAFSLWIKSQWR